ncbi:MAG: chloride channel protein [Lachnospiraceae bacterium]|nr:chloride channel protein [Lachnospiraceae bacterium]
MKRKIQLIKFYIGRIYKNLLRFFRWTVFSVITGAVVGAFSTAFVLAFDWCIDMRNAHRWLLYFLPVAGCIIVALYGVFKYKNDRGTNLVLSTIHSQDEIPFKMAPLIFISTLLTHLCGGSSGREGAALQLGGSLGNTLGRFFKFDEKDKHVVVMCGMSAAFAVMFGTPIAAVIFSMEVVSVGLMYYAALVPCVFAATVAIQISKFAGVHGHVYEIIDAPDMQLLPVVEIVVLALLCALISVLFCMLLHGLGDFYRDKFKNPYIRIVFSSCLIIAINVLVGNDDYMGTGLPVVARAIEGEAVPYAFLLKMILTALTLEAGFKGGEIVPSFFIGATFGATFGALLHLSPSLCAAVGMLAVFCGVTNCPVTSILLAFELFGRGSMLYLLIGISVSYLMSGYYGLYHDQTIVYSKYKTEYINRKTKER